MPNLTSNGLTLHGIQCADAPKSVLAANIVMPRLSPTGFAASLAMRTSVAFNCDLYRRNLRRQFRRSEGWIEALAVGVPLPLKKHAMETTKAHGISCGNVSFIEQVP